MSRPQDIIEAAAEIQSLRMGTSFAGEKTALDAAILNYTITQNTADHQRAEAAKHAGTIQAMKDDRALGLGRMYGPDCYSGSPGWWRSDVRKRIKQAHTAKGCIGPDYTPGTAADAFATVY